MQILSGYKTLKLLYESVNSLVYCALREADQQSIILKILKEDYPSPTELTRYRQEYAITHNLTLDGVVKAYSLEPYQHTLVMVLEDFGATSLKLLKQGQPLPLKEFLPLAIKICHILGEIHQHNIIHKDINPSNIVLNPETGQLKIIDFGISTQLNRENPTLKNPHVLEGTLAYISPEQTGRMNRSLDYRSDFYSLGITFYELLTGKLPFETTDPLELVHCHIAKTALPLGEKRKGEREEIPGVVENIVMKLMAKTAEERYQSAWGIKADLEKCLQQLEKTDAIAPFPLGCQDISNKFQIPQKLYGRDKEIEALWAAFEGVAADSQGEMDLQIDVNQLSSSIPHHSKVEMMLVAGYAGIGKSALVAEIHKPITKERGYFTSGKFDQLQHNIPYSALISAFEALIKQFLTESDLQLKQWQEKLLAALGSNGQVIIDVIPEVELIIGKQQAVPKLGASETQNRFNLVFGNFIRAFCSREHPLVIFLDDLQWADSATLKLIELMMTSADLQHLFLIGAYRDNEVNPTHPLMITLERLREEQVTVSQITLAPLELDAVNQLMAETLHSEIAVVKPLAKLVLNKTDGNPFFVNQFLKTLYSENLIRFSLTEDCQSEQTKSWQWQWELSQIEAQNITDNVVELMISKVKKLPEATQEILQLAACIGANFNLDTLEIISQKPGAAIFQDLLEALLLGLIRPISELDNELLIQKYQFEHDRVQQAAYALIGQGQKQAVHLQIGRLLLQSTAPKSLAEDIFTIVDHLNLGIELVTQQKERIEIAQLNLLAGKKAKAANAYESAVNYLQQGRGLLTADCWQREYDLTLDLYVESVETEYLKGNYDEVEALFSVVVEQGKTTLDKVGVYGTKILLYSAQNQMEAAIDIGREVLQLLGISWCQTKPQISQVEALYNLPRMREPNKEAALKILMMLFGPIYTTNPALLAPLALTMVEICLNYGNSPLAAYAYGLYGLLLCAGEEEIDLGYQFGQLALNVLKTFDTKEIKCRVYNKFYSFILHWQDTVSKSLEPLRETIQIGLETGDIENLIGN